MTARVAITGGTLIDVRTGTSQPNTTVLIEGERIVSVGSTNTFAAPPDARVVDVTGKWLLPGLIDMHAHLTGEHAALKEKILHLYLANGVTTVRGTGGNLTQTRLLRVDLLKVYNWVPEASLQVILETAHGFGVPVTGHVPRTITMTRAIQLGMDCLEHIRITGRELLSVDEARQLDPLPVARRETLLWQRFVLNSDGLQRLVRLVADSRVFSIRRCWSTLPSALTATASTWTIRPMPTSRLTF